MKKWKRDERQTVCEKKDEKKKNNNANEISRKCHKQTGK